MCKLCGTRFLFYCDSFISPTTYDFDYRLCYCSKAHINYAVMYHQNLPRRHLQQYRESNAALAPTTSYRSLRGTKSNITNYLLLMLLVDADSSYKHN